MGNMNDPLIGIAYWSPQTNAVAIRVLMQDNRGPVLKDFNLPIQSSQPVADFMVNPINVDVIPDNQYFTDFLTDCVEGVQQHRYVYIGDQSAQPMFKVIGYDQPLDALLRYFDQEVPHP